MAAVLAWLAPRSAAVRSLRLRASDNSGRKDLMSPVSWAQFVPLLNNITNEHERQLVARKMQPLLMAAWAEPDYPHVQHDYTRYTAHFVYPNPAQCTSSVHSYTLNPYIPGTVPTTSNCNG